MHKKLTNMDRLRRYTVIHTPNEHKSYVKVANESSLSLSAWIRNVCNYFVKQKNKFDKDKYDKFITDNPLTNNDLAVLHKFSLNSWYTWAEYKGLNFTDAEVDIVNMLIDAKYILRKVNTSSGSTGLSYELKRVL